jgi:hypothetical protein
MQPAIRLSVPFLWRHSNWTNRRKVSWWKCKRLISETDFTKSNRTDHRRSRNHRKSYYCRQTQIHPRHRHVLNFRAGFLHELSRWSTSTSACRFPREILSQDQLFKPDTISITSQLMPRQTRRCDWLTIQWGPDDLSLFWIELQFSNSTWRIRWTSGRLLWYILNGCCNVISAAFREVGTGKRMRPISFGSIQHGKCRNCWLMWIVLHGCSNLNWKVYSPLSNPRKAISEQTHCDQSHHSEQGE